MIKRRDEIIPADGSIYADIPDDITAKELIGLLKEIPGDTIIQNPAQNVLRGVLVDNHGTPLTPISDVPEIEECEVNDTTPHYLISDEYFGVMSGLDELDKPNIQFWHALFLTYTVVRPEEVLIPQLVNIFIPVVCPTRRL